MIELRNNNLLIELHEINNSVDCTWGPWGSWSACSKTCGGGTRTQTRIKSVVEANGGDCIGKNQQEETCNQEKCRKYNRYIFTTVLNVMCSSTYSNAIYFVKEKMYL